jgi:hypothetical protein
MTLGLRIAAGLVLVAAALTGCADSDLAAGCTRPANESELLDAYAADPVLDVRPPQAHDVRQPTRSTACQGWRQVQAETRESLRYCRQVRGVTSYLLISAVSPRPEVGVRGPSGVAPSASPRAVTLSQYVSVRIAAAPEQPSCE